MQGWSQWLSGTPAGDAYSKINLLISYTTMFNISATWIGSIDDNYEGNSTSWSEGYLFQFFVSSYRRTSYFMVRLAHKVPETGGRTHQFITVGY